MSGSCKPLVLSLMVAVATTACWPATGAPAADESPDATTTLQAVVVTGTRATDRTLAASLAPIDVVTAADLARTGAVDLPRALRLLLPSFNLPQPSMADITDATQPAQLRGLSPDQTLVLVNGLRLHSSAPVNVIDTIGLGSSPADLSAIPLNAVARIEVLRDGAAAQYGSDAIAGVINIILKHGAAGGSAQAGWGVYDGGQGATWRAGADDGMALGEGGWLRWSVNYLNQDTSNHSGPDTRAPGDPTYGEVTSRFGLPRLITRQAAVNGQLVLGDATLYGFAVLNSREVGSNGVFRPLLSYQDSAPAAVAEYPAGYLPLQRNAVNDDMLALGLRGTLGGWQYDLSAASGGNHYKRFVEHSFNYSLGADSPTQFYVGTLVARQDTVNAEFRRQLAWAGHAPLSVAWGLAWRRGSYQIKAGEPASWLGTGAQSAPGQRPSDAGRHQRHNSAAWLDIEADLSDRLAAGLAVRHERYSDFGHATAWKLSGRYAFSPALAVRATASTGFRAPSLPQQFFSTTGAQVAPDENGEHHLVLTRTFPVSDPTAIALGAQPLRPERSKNINLGLVWTPDTGPWLTLDLYRIDIDERIILSAKLIGDAVSAFLAEQGFPGVGGGRFFINGVDTRTRGADLVATWPIALARSDLRLMLGANWNKTELLAVDPTPPQLGLAGIEVPLVGRSTRKLITGSSPRSKAFLAADWQRGGWSWRARLTRWGEYQEPSAYPSVDQVYPAELLLDASLSYAANGWRFTLGGNNIGNVYPERHALDIPFTRIFPYSEVAPFGFNGVYWYANAGYRW